MSIFGQVWVFSAAAFVLGAFLTWLFLVRPAQRRIRELEHQLAMTAPPQPVAVDGVQETTTLMTAGDELSTEIETSTATVSSGALPSDFLAGTETGPDIDLVEVTHELASGPGWPEREERHDSHTAALDRPDEYVGEDSGLGEGRNRFDELPDVASTDEATGADEHAGLPIRFEFDDMLSEVDEQVQSGFDEVQHAARPGELEHNTSLFEPVRPAEPAEDEAADELDFAFLESTRAEEVPAPAAPLEELADPNEQEASYDQAQALPKRQPQQSAPEGFGPPEPIQPSIRSIPRREADPDPVGARSGSLFEPMVAPTGYAPPAREAEPVGNGLPPGPFGPGSAMPRPDGGRPSEEFAVKASVTALRYCTQDSPQFPEIVAEVWFRTPADAERVGFRPLN